jgi:hypothetical protein
MKDSFVFAINEASDAYCDITLAEVDQARVNLAFSREEFTNTPWAQYVFGNRVRYSYTPDLSVSVVTHDIYLPSVFFTELLADQFNSTSVAIDTCEVLETICPATFEYNNFESREECVSQMTTLPTITANERGLATVDGNSTGCRALHSSLAQRSPSVHCPHISFSPQNDTSGKVKCSGEGKNTAPEEYFTKEDFALFTRTAGAFGLNVTAQVRTKVTTQDMGTCELGGINEDVLVGFPGLPGNYLCAKYLESQDATGSNDAQYWATLIAMFVFFRLLALYLLRKKLKNE